MSPALSGMAARASGMSSAGGDLSISMNASAAVSNNGDNSNIGVAGGGRGNRQRKMMMAKLQHGGGFGPQGCKCHLKRCQRCKSCIKRHCRCPVPLTREEVLSFSSTAKVCSKVKSEQ